MPASLLVRDAQRAQGGTASRASSLYGVRNAQGHVGTGGMPLSLLVRVCAVGAREALRPGPWPIQRLPGPRSGAGAYALLTYGVCAPHGRAWATEGPAPCRGNGSAMLPLLRQRHTKRPARDMAAVVSARGGAPGCVLRLCH